MTTVDGGAPMSKRKKRILAYLEKHGASYGRDISRGIGLRWWQGTIYIQLSDLAEEGHVISWQCQLPLPKNRQEIPRRLYRLAAPSGGGRSRVDTGGLPAACR